VVHNSVVFFFTKLEHGRIFSMIFFFTLILWDSTVERVGVFLHAFFFFKISFCFRNVQKVIKNFIKDRNLNSRVGVGNTLLGLWASLLIGNDSFFLHPYIFLPALHKVMKRQNCPYKLYIFLFRIKKIR